jgi:hypothetical protein
MMMTASIYPFCFFGDIDTWCGFLAYSFFLADDDALHGLKREGLWIRVNELGWRGRQAKEEGLEEKD